MCVFCGDINLTREHVFPNWMAKLFAEKTSTTTVIERDGEVQSSYVSPVFQQTLKRVCKACNNGWMSDLEAKVKPIIEPMLFRMDYSTELTQSEQDTLAFWTQKTSMILSLSTGSDYRIPESHFHELYDKLEPIDSISVRIGWRLPKKGKYGQHIAHYTVSEVKGPDNENLPTEVNGEVWRGILAIGNLVFHQSGATEDLKVELANNDDRVTPQIHPFIQNIRWPIEWPVDALTSAGLKEFNQL